jgi:hypothetical protein
MKVTVPHATLPRNNPRLAAVKEAIEAVKALPTDGPDDWADIQLCAGGDDARFLFVWVKVQASTEAMARAPLDLIFKAARGDGTRILLRRAPIVEVHKDFEADRVIWVGYTRFVWAIPTGMLSR